MYIYTHIYLDVQFIVFPVFNLAFKGPQENRPDNRNRVAIQKPLVLDDTLLPNTYSDLIDVANTTSFTPIHYFECCHKGQHNLWHMFEFNKTQYSVLSKWIKEFKMKKSVMFFDPDPSMKCDSEEFYFVSILDGFIDEFVSYYDSECLHPNMDEQAPQDVGAENVHFLDETKGFESNISSNMDQIRETTYKNDSDLGDFLSRPVLIKHLEVPIGIDLDETLFVWQDFFKSPYTARRLMNFKLLSAKLHLKFVINGTPFHYGRVLCAYTPLAGEDDLTYLSGTEVDFVGLSQRPHVFLDPTDCKGGDIICPFMWYKNTIDVLHSEDFTYMGGLNIRTITPMKHSNGAVDPVTISVYAWAEDVTLSVPTQFIPEDMSPIPTAQITRSRPTRASKLYPNMDEYQLGPVSRPATTIASIANKLSTIPFIYPYAKATEIGAKAMGKMAALFGYSRPTIITTGIYKPSNKGSFATSNQDDDVQKLSLDVKQELSIDPTIFGGMNQDEMEIKYIASKESYLTNFPISNSAKSEDLIWNCMVDPQLYRITGSGNSAKIHMPALCFASFPFRKWRGSINFRFQVVCSKYHRGRIKVVYDPEGTFGDTNTDTSYNTAYTTVVDIRETTDFTIKAGWGQSKTYRNSTLLLSPENLLFDTSQLPYLSSYDDFSNGTISVYMVTELGVPDSTINNDISVNVFVSAGDDFEVAEPNAEKLAKLRLNSPSDILNAPDTYRKKCVVLEPNMFELQPNAMEDQDTAPQSNENDAPEQKSSVVDLAATTSLVDRANLIHFGESIRSFRQYLKRYSMHELVNISRESPEPNAKQIFHTIQRTALPHDVGFTDTSTTLDPTYYPVDGENYVFGYMTPLRYLTTAFVGWRGGVRWAIDNTGVSCGCDGARIVTTRSSPCAIKDSCEYVNKRSPDMDGINQAFDFFKEATLQEGGTITSPAVNPITSVEIPYYSDYRFAPARRKSDFSNASYEWMPSFKHKIYYAKENLENERIHARNYCTYVSAAEDFQVCGFIGAPPFHYEA